MVDMKKLNQELTSLFISVEYGRWNVVDLFNCTASDMEKTREKAIRLYQNDPAFHARVESVVAHTLQVVNNIETPNKLCGLCKMAKSECACSSIMW